VQKNPTNTKHAVKYMTSIVKNMPMKLLIGYITLCLTATILETAFVSLCVIIHIKALQQ